MELLTVQEVAQMLKVDPETVRRWIREGKLTAHRAGAQYRITKEAVEAFLTRRGTGAN